MLFVEFDGPTPHTVMASVPMPLHDQPAAEVLTELAAALRQTDMLRPRHDDEDCVGLRALAWARCRDHLGDWPEWEALLDEQRAALIDDFVATAGLPDDDVTRSLAGLFLDCGDGYITAGTLAWSPGAVMPFENPPPWATHRIWMGLNRGHELIPRPLT